MSYSPDALPKEEGASSEPKKPARRSRFQLRILDLVGLNILIAVNMLVWHVILEASSFPHTTFAFGAISLTFPLCAAYITYRLATERRIESPVGRLLLLVLIEFGLVAMCFLMPILARLIYWALH